MHYVNTTNKAKLTPGTTPERYQDIIAERKYVFGIPKNGWAPFLI
jgi:hypothetical protein